MEQKLNYLFNKYINDTADNAEVDEFYKILDEGDHDKLLEQLADETYSPVVENEQQDEIDYYPPGAAHRMLEKIFKSETEGTLKGNKVGTLKLWLKLTIAAAIATVIVSMGIWFVKKQGENSKLIALTSAANFAPGKQEATLTLANGKKIRLSDAVSGELAKESNVTITKTEDGQITYEFQSALKETKQNYNTLSTAKGETYRLRLPDGSLVWLNAASSLTYSTSLTEHGKRRVKLEGEGYFEITKDKLRPFIVESSGQELEVLGTHFNVDNYEADIKTTLIEGSVRITSGAHTAILKPGEQSSVLSGKDINVSKVDTYASTAWKDGYFYFKHEGIIPIMNRLADWYDIEIIYEGKITNEKFRGNISRDLKLSAVLNMLSYSDAVHFRVEGRRVIVMQ